MSVKRFAGESMDYNVAVKRSGREQCEPNWSSLIRVAAQGNVKEVERLLRQEAAETDRENADGKSALAVASLSGHLQIVNLLLEFSGARVVWDLSAKPVHLAAQNGHIAVARALLERAELAIRPGGSEQRPSDQLVNLRDSKGRTALHLAARDGHGEMVKYLLSKGALQLADQADETPLHLAAERGHATVVECLIGNGLAYHSRLGGPRTPLHIAAQQGQEEVVEVLLRQRQVDVNAQFGSNLLTPLHLAARSGHELVVRRLLAQDSIRHLEDASGKTALEMALEEGYSVCAQMIASCFGL